MQFDDNDGRLQARNDANTLHQRLVVLCPGQEVSCPTFRLVVDCAETTWPHSYSAAVDRVFRSDGDDGGGGGGCRNGRGSVNRTRPERGSVAERKFGRDHPLADLYLETRRRITPEGDAPDAARMILHGADGRRREERCGVIDRLMVVVVWRRRRRRTVVHEYDLRDSVCSGGETNNYTVAVFLT